MWTTESRALVGDFGAGQALSDEQYALLVPLIPPAKPGGRPRTTDMRRLLDGLSLPRRRGRVAKVDLSQPGGDGCRGRDAGSRTSSRPKL